MRYVVLTISNDGNSAAVCESLEDAKATARRMLSDPDSTGEVPMYDDERARMERALAEVTENYQPEIPGGSRWKESAYIAPVGED